MLVGTKRQRIENDVGIGQLWRLKQKTPPSHIAAQPRTEIGRSGGLTVGGMVRGHRVYIGKFNFLLSSAFEKKCEELRGH